MKYTVKILKSEEVATGTKQFYLEKPADLVFKAGQFMDVTIPNPSETDAEGNTRAFSITAAPNEDHISFATRMRDTAFKRVVGAMPAGSELNIDAPMGSFTLHNNTAKPAVFLAGGIGITPFHSIIKNAAMQKLPHKIYLFFSNRTPADAPFFAELQAVEKQNPNFKMVATMTDDKTWSGEKGYIDFPMLQRHITESIEEAIFYMAGPAAMVAAMRKMLEEAKVDSDNIKTEEFSGY